jgi:hypothetical protein
MDFASLSPAATAEKVTWVREAAGERFEELEMQLLVSRTAVTDTPRRVAEEMRAAWRMGDETSVDDVLASPHTLIGSEDRIVDKLLETRGRFAVSYFTVLESAMEEFAPVVVRLAGQ